MSKHKNPRVQAALKAQRHAANEADAVLKQLDRIDNILKALGTAGYFLKSLAKLSEGQRRKIKAALNGGIDQLQARYVITAVQAFGFSPEPEVSETRAVEELTRAERLESFKDSLSGAEFTGIKTEGDLEEAVRLAAMAPALEKADKNFAQFRDGVVARQVLERLDGSVPAPIDPAATLAEQEQAFDGALAAEAPQS